MQEKNRSTGSVISYDPESFDRLSTGVRSSMHARKNTDTSITEEDLEENEVEANEDESFVFGKSSLSEAERVKFVGFEDVPPPPNRESSDSAPPPPANPPPPAFVDENGNIDVNELKGEIAAENNNNEESPNATTRRQMLLKRMNSIHEANTRVYSEIVEEYNLAADNVTLLLDSLNFSVDDPTLLGGKTDLTNGGGNSNSGEIRLDTIDTMERILNDVWMREIFEKMLKKEFAAESYNFWLEVNLYKYIGDEAIMASAAVRIYDKFVKEGSDE